MTSEGEARISVVMVSWHTGPVLVQAIEAALSAHDVDELVLVNHGNPAERVEYLEEVAASDPRFILIHSGGNLGFAKGCNIGAKAAAGRHLLFLNPDAILGDGVAARLARTGSRYGEPWLVGARLLSRNGREQRGARRGELTLTSAFLGFTGLWRLFPGAAIHREHEPLPEEAIEVPCVSGAALMMSKAGYEGVGGFDEAYFLHVEDIDLCRRVREAGGSVVFDPQANIVHFGGSSQASALFVARHKVRGFIRYFWRFASPGKRVAVVALAPFFWAAIMGRAALTSARRRAKA